jgi:hypothetical protein
MQDEQQKVRMAKTESLFRDVNERIAEAADRLHSDEADFVCECSDSACTHRVPVPLDDYEEVREEPTRFVLANGHENPGIERVVVRRSRFSIVEKIERTVVRHVRRLDPRAERT